MENEYCDYCFELIDDCQCDEWDDYMDDDNGPTGHGDICHSDADPGL